MKEGNIVARSGEHLVKWGTDKLATTDESDFGMFKIDIVASKKPIDGGGGGGIKITMA